MLNTFIRQYNLSYYALTQFEHFVPDGSSLIPLNAICYQYAFMIFYDIALPPLSKQCHVYFFLAL